MPTNGPSPKNQAHINIVHAFENSDLPIGGGPRLIVKKFLTIKFRTNFAVIHVTCYCNMFYINLHRLSDAQRLHTKNPNSYYE